MYGLAIPLRFPLRKPHDRLKPNGWSFPYRPHSSWLAFMRPEIGDEVDYILGGVSEVGWFLDRLAANAG